ncbi:MAG: peptidylprolyl isomerase, partial [Rhodothermia bacterium]|nr:peptidylprolyl isomerase [Rhodothermia bacterium]
MTSRTFFAVATLLGFVAVAAGCASGSKLIQRYAEDPTTVAVIKGAPLSLQEFEKHYAKTVGGRAEAEQDSVGEYRDFLDRWVDFRLKVMAAREAGLDRDSALVAELDGYRGQFARPFLMDREVTDPLIRNLYDKRQQMVDASHILLRVDQGALASDTARIHAELSAIRDSILAGSDFGDMAFRHSEDPSASSNSQGPGYRGRLGFVRGGRLVPEFEEVAFSIPLGEISHVFRTQFGYHILQVHDRKPAVPDVRISHIMVTPQSPDDSAAAWQEIRAIKDSLDAGVAFAELARRNSDDAGSARAGGDIGFVAIDGRLVPAIKNAAFDLEEIGDYTDPIETQFGIHIVQLTGRKPVQSLDDAYEDLRRQVSRSPQMEERQREFAGSILSEYGFTMDSTGVAGLFGGLDADSASSLVSTRQLKSSSPDLTVATIGTKSFTHADLIEWLYANPVRTYSDIEDYVDHVVDGFLRDKAIEYKLSRLEDENEEFRQTMSDFVDGLLLFRIMDDSVWTRAASDSVELRRRFDADPKRFIYPDRYRIVSIYTRTKSVADSVAALLDANRRVAEISAAFPD